MIHYHEKFNSLKTDASQFYNKLIVSYHTASQNMLSDDVFIYWYITDVLHTHTMEQGASGGANRFSASQEIPRILWKPKVHYRIHKCPPSVLITTQSTQSHPTSWRPILILSTYLSLDLPCGLSPSGLPTKRLSPPPYVPHALPINSSPFHHPKNIVWAVQIIKLLIM